MSPLRQFYRAVFLLLIVVVSALFLHQAKQAKANTTAVSTVCTLGHYQRNAPSLAMLVDGHHNPFGKHKSAHKKDVQSVVVFLFSSENFMGNKPRFSAALLEPSSLQDVYRYLYFKEINPPPPKTC